MKKAVRKRQRELGGLAATGASPTGWKTFLQLDLTWFAAMTAHACTIAHLFFAPTHAMPKTKPDAERVELLNAAGLWPICFFLHKFLRP